MLAWKPTLVGFTCMFDQTIASVAIGQRLKAMNQQTLVALGGYAVRPPTGEMLLEAFSCVDAICIGEGERVIEPLARASVEWPFSLETVPNLLYRDSSGGVVSSRPAGQISLEDSPVPNYDDFFADVRDIQTSERVRIGIDRLPIENSRGCWWGAEATVCFAESTKVTWLTDTNPLKLSVKHLQF